MSGETLDNAPEWTGNIGAEYRDSLSVGDLEWFARVDATLKDETNMDPTLYYLGEENSYTLLSARIGLESPDQGWTVTLWGNNLTDEEYFISKAFEQNNLISTQGTPATYGVTADWRF